MLHEAILDYLKGSRMTAEQVQARRDICSTCEFKTEGALSQCKKCKCFLEGELGKLKAPREKCPIGKWNEQQ